MGKTTEMISELCSISLHYCLLQYQLDGLNFNKKAKQFAAPLLGQAHPCTGARAFFLIAVWNMNINASSGLQYGRTKGPLACSVPILFWDLSSSVDTIIPLALFNDASKDSIKKGGDFFNSFFSTFLQAYTSCFIKIFFLLRGKNSPNFAEGGFLETQLPI